MKFSLGKSVQIGATFVGAVVGAGFASGQEIIQFFLVFGSSATYGMVISGILFALFGMAVLFLVERFDAQSYQDLVNGLFGHTLGRMMDYWIILFLLAGLCIMLAGSATVFSEHLKLPGSLGLAVTSACVILAVFGEGRGVMWINSLLIPFLAVVTVLVGFTSLMYGETVITTEFSTGSSAGSLVGKNWAVAALLYVSYNMVIGAVILASLGKQQVGGNVLGGAFGGICLGVMSLVMGVAMLRFSNYIFFYEIPMLYLAGRLHPIFKYFYTLVLWSAMLTTAVANAYGLTRRLGSLLPMSD